MLPTVLQPRSLLLLLTPILTVGYLLLSPPAHAGTIIQAPNNIGLTNGLVGHWTFDGPDVVGVTAYDKSGQGNHGTLTNGPAKAIGKIGQALTFDGVDDYVLMSSDLIDVGTVTVCAWIYPNALNTGTYQAVVSNDRFTFGVQNANSQFHINSSNSGGGLNSTVGSLSAKTWQHICGVRLAGANGSATLYLNGTFNVSGNTITPTSGVIPVLIGITSDPFQFKGPIDDVRIYNRALSPDEIKRLYNLGGTFKINQPVAGGSLTQGLVGYWSFDAPDMSTTTALDRSGQGNNGTLTNGPTKTIGKIGQALKIDGVNDSTDVSDNDIAQGVSSMSTSVWFKSSVFSVDINRHIVAYTQVAGVATADLRIRRSGIGGQLRFDVTNSSDTTSSADSDTEFLSTDWNHAVGVYDGSTVRLYLNGVLQGTSASLSGTTKNNTGGVQFGTQNATEFFGGLIDDVRIYNRALSPDEIKRLSNLGGTFKINAPANTGTLKDGLVGHWSFDYPDMAGITAFDRSGQGNNGTLTNGPTKTIGKIGQALALDGVNDYVNIGDPASGVLDFDVGSFSFGQWVRITEPDSDGFQLPLNKGSQSQNNEGYTMSYVQHSTIRACITDTGDGSFPTCAGRSGTMLDGTWHHIFAVVDRDSQLLRFYFDGVATQSTDISSVQSVSTSNELQVGVAVTYNLHGSTDDVRIYNRALAADEIKRLYNMGR